MTTSIPSPTIVTQDAKSLLEPFTSTMQRRQAPTGVRPSRLQSVGIWIPFSRAASRIDSSSRAETSRSSIVRVLTLLDGAAAAGLAGGRAAHAAPPAGGAWPAAAASPAAIFDSYSSRK